jgi:membrane-associated HD superfamily phosphohydrolase
MSQMDREIIQLHVVGAKKDNTIVEKDNTIVEKDNTITELTTQNTEKDNTIVEKDNTITEQTTQNTEKDNTITEITTQIYTFYVFNLIIFFCVLCS